MVAGVARVFGAACGPAELRRLAASSAASLNRTRADFCWVARMTVGDPPMRGFSLTPGSDG
jgi:hypothetical protein